MKEIIAKIQIFPQASIKQALKLIDKAGLAILFVCEDNGVLIGSLTDGDIRRRILETGDLQETIASCFKRQPVYVLQDSYTIEDVKKLMLKMTIDVIPVVDSNKNIVDILFWRDIFEENVLFHKEIDIPVVIMAGGRGQRLEPFTKILPKPLIPIGEKPVIEVIIDKFNRQGIKNFYITLNYKGEMIKTYLESIEKKFRISYIWEEEFLGTAGSLGLLPSDMLEPFIVSNSDIIVNINYYDFVSFHNENKNILTVAGSIQHYKIPYGIIHFEKEGKIKKIQEKPELDFTVNAGLYVLSRKALEFIPKNSSFDMTDLLQVLLDRKEPIGVYPVSQKAYLDVGHWGEYKKTIENLQLID